MTVGRAETTQIPARHLSHSRQRLGGPGHGLPGSQDELPIPPPDYSALSADWRVLRTILAERYYYWRRTAASKHASRSLLRRQGKAIPESAIETK
jgi:hypothetical protein